MCQAGFHVLEIFPLTYAYPNGTGIANKPWGDSVHYVRETFLPVEEYLYDYFTTNLKN